MLDILSPADRDFLAAVTAFVESDVLPHAHRREGAGYPADLFARMRELGLFSACTRDLRTYALAIEELARGWLSLLPIVNAHSSSVWACKFHATAAQRRQWLPWLLAGDQIAALALTEQQGGTDLAHLKWTAEPVAGRWHITASKSLITHAGHADLMLILVRTDPDSALAHRGLSLFLLSQGEWAVDREIPKLGSRGIETCEISVDTIVPADRLIGEVPGRGFAQAMDILEIGRIAVATAAIGVGRRALWNAIEYARERATASGLVAELPTARQQLGSAAAQLAAAKALALSAADTTQRGGRHDLEASAAKVAAASAALTAALTAMEIGGGWAYAEDLEFARLLRDSALFIAGEGSNSVLTSLVGGRLVNAEPSLSWI